MSDRAIVLSTAETGLAVPPNVVERARAFARKPMAAATLRNYASDWKRFADWCKQTGAVALPSSAETIVQHLTALSLSTPPLKYNSIARAYTSIRAVHKAKGHSLGTLEVVGNALRNIQRDLTDRRVFEEPKKELSAEQILAAADKLPSTLRGKRDRMVLLFGFALAQRRSDIVRIEVGDIEEVPEGLRVAIRRSKTDQRGKGHTVPVIREGGRGCPVGALEDWLRASGITEGPIARRIYKGGKKVTARGIASYTVYDIVRTAAKSLGLDPKQYGAHSLRRGFVTSAARAGRDVSSIMDTTGHKSVEQVRKYIGDSVLMDRAAGRGLLATHPTTGQPLVNRAAELLTRRGKPVARAWVVGQAAGLQRRGLSSEQIAEILTMAGVCRGGRPRVTAGEVERWLAGS